MSEEGEGGLPPFHKAVVQHWSQAAAQVPSVREVNIWPQQAGCLHNMHLLRLAMAMRVYLPVSQRHAASAAAGMESAFR